MVRMVIGCDVIDIVWFINIFFDIELLILEVDVVVDVLFDDDFDELV